MNVARPCRRQDVWSEEIDGEVVVCAPAETQVTYLNATAAVIWQLCDGSLTVEEIVELIRREVPEARTTAADDTHAAIAAFARAGLLSAGP